MRAALSLVGLGFAACYAPIAPDGAPCVPPPLGAGACPTGQVCSPGGVCVAPGDGAPDDAAIDGPPDVPSFDDADRDGVADASDNCPAVANRDQANDDADPFGDACDPCPPFADPLAFDDPDGDGVSGACDPFPAAAGDRIAVFESFRAASRPPGWVELGSWTFPGDDAVVTSNNGDLHYLTLLRAHPARTTVITRFTVLDLVGSGTRGIGAAQMYQPEPSRSIVCELLRAGSGPTLLLNDTGGAGNALAGTPSTFDPGDTVTLVNRRDGTDYACSDPAESVSGTTAYTTGAPSVGLRSRSVSARFAWLLVVE